MPEVFASFLASLLRHALTGLAVYFVTHGYFTQSQADNYIAAFIVAVLGLGWSYWQKYRSRILFLTGLEAKPGTDPMVVETAVAKGGGVPLAAILLPLLLLVGLSASACGPKNPNLSPQGQTAATAHEVVLRVNELENTVIQASQTGGLSESTARVLVTFCVDADKTLEATPLGWRETVRTGWTAVKKQIGNASANPSIAAAFSAADALITALAGDQ